MRAQQELDGVRDKNIMQLRKLNVALFPIRYNDKYYTDALLSGEYTKLGQTYSNVNENIVSACAAITKADDNLGNVFRYLDDHKSVDSHFGPENDVNESAPTAIFTSEPGSQRRGR